MFDLRRTRMQLPQREQHGYTGSRFVGRIGSINFDFDVGVDRNEIVLIDLLHKISYFFWFFFSLEQHLFFRFL